MAKVLKQCPDGEGLRTLRTRSEKPGSTPFHIGKEMRDPKFGYHWIWIFPLVLVLELRDRIVLLYKWARIRWIEFRNPEIKELKKLAGK